MASRRSTTRVAKRAPRRAAKRAAKRSTSGRRDGRSGARNWSARVTAQSNALDLDPRVFTWKDPRRIAASLKRSAERSRRRKGTAYQSAMSMLNFYINRGGRALTADRKRVLERAKQELRKQFGKAPET